ncbi:TonB-dependent receptor, partial [Brucella sp. 21LCYQ03]|nr:TonB-dependent receptor [Brucella sp. 21LCYQ03]
MYLDNTSSLDRSIDPSFVNNLRALYTLSAWGLERVDLNLAVNNVLNTKFATNGYTWGSIDPSGTHNFYNFYFPQATINFLLGLNIRF